MTTLVAAVVYLGIGVLVVLYWLTGRTQKRRLRAQFVELNAERRATLDQHITNDEATETASLSVRSTQVTPEENSSGGIAPPGATVTPLSLHRRNGRPFTEDPGKR
jgi:hypothetical protein